MKNEHNVFLILKTVNIYIPTFNAGSRWKAVLQALNRQTYPINCNILVDSGSSDNTVAAARDAGFQVLRVDSADFDHGGTRQFAVEQYPEADIYVFFTQDAVPADADTLTHIVQVFDDPEVGIAYGRQLPNPDATVLEAHARLYNYSPKGYVRQLRDADKYGVKTIFCSNSFAAYRRTAFESVGGFPKNTIMGEDVITAGNLVRKGWKIAYAAAACVYHSHDYTLGQEFARYFDIGVFHRLTPWIIDTFGHANREGLKYAKSEINYVGRHNPLLLPKVGCSFFAKWFGYQLGLRYRMLPLNLRRTFSMHKRYWDKSL